MLDHAVAELNGARACSREALGNQRVYELDPLSDPRWAALLASHPLASVFHTPAWLRALEKTYGYRPVALTTAPPGACLTNAIVFCEVDSWFTGRGLVSVPFSDHCDPLIDRPADLESLLHHASRGLEEGRYRRMEIRPRSTPDVEMRGFEPKGGAVLHRLSLAGSADELFRSFHKDCIQRKIRRAARENLVYEEGNSDAQLNEFYRLLTMTRKRHGLPPQPLRWFQALITTFGSHLKIRLVRREAAAVASILTLSHRNTMVYKYGCSDASANKYGGTPMLFWQTIQEAKRNGQVELDMGRSDLDDPGLSVFKEHWGSVPTPLTYWRYPAQPLRANRAWQKVWATRVVAATPSPILQLAGHILYRHMG